MSGSDENAVNVERLVLMITLLLVFAMAARTPLDTDLWWHLAAGHETVSTGKVMLVDTFSYTKTGVEWLNHSWLSQVLLYLVDLIGGFYGLMLVVAILATTAIALLWRQMVGSALLKAFVVVLVVATSAVIWTPRPQIVSYVMVAVCGSILYRWRKGEDVLWMLLPMFVLWSNLHGGYVLGLIYLGGALAGELLNRLIAKPVDTHAWRRNWQRLLRYTVGAMVVVVINPNGIGMWRIPFQTIGVGTLQQLIPEWASPDFHEAVQQPFLWMLLLAIGAAGLARRRMDGVDLVHLILFGVLALSSRRNIAPFALVAAPILSRLLPEAAAGWKERLNWIDVPKWMKTGWMIGERRQIPDSLRKGINLGLVGLVGLAAFGKAGVVALPAVVKHYEQGMFPVNAVQWIRQYHPEYELFNSYAWGGYLTRNLPEYPVFCDGRTDLFGDEILGEWLKVVQMDSGWEEVLKKYGIRTILIEANTPLGVHLVDYGWIERYRDALAVVFTAP